MESTQAIARQLAEEAATEGTTVQASSQSAGRGRLGNSFFSPPGGLYLSVVLRPSVEPRQAGLIGLAAGLGVAEGIQEASGLRATLKWPNDLLIDGRKLCGLLVDLVAEAQQVRYAILGIGVNVNIARQLFPAELQAAATSLSEELGRELPLGPVRDAVLARLEACYRTLCTYGPERVRQAWRAWPNMLGQRVRTATGDAGVAEDVDVDGALLLRRASGEVRRVVAGEIHLAR